ncbi:ABC transporter permease subunit [Rathayibacter sp. VKM Ac-2803]|uniref:carbohydrate ABC transporter permease n=1 Tax=unclassified Rathayibacter TaxID=2609250 RepID=UPI001357B543|nr:MULTISPECIES: sugar ABC transporter permease [unclassified Rathayibacter]MWV47948.1 ABC transporter permease subunit [Rathayibacter sp. VKM Ac-2803]MWV58836.1 ABC transporter permease subunit [Rathayibacter sp. VKM Ac-2754]
MTQLAGGTGPTGPAPAADLGPSSDGRGPGRGRRRSRRDREENRTGLLLLAPTLVIVLVAVVVPILWAVALAFQPIRLLNIRGAGFFGEYTLENFADVLTSPGFFAALRTTVVYSVGGTALAIGIGLVAALALRRPFRGRSLVRAALLLPYVAPVVAATFVWSTMLNPQFGVVNWVGTNLLGWDDPVAFLSQRSLPVMVLGVEVQLPIALLTVILFEAWRSFPFAFLFLTARLAAVPEVLDEAARIDGATPSQRFRHILLPQLLPTIAVLSVLRFIWTFNNFDDIYLLTGGGAGTEVVSVRVFDYLTARGDIGAASAQALVLAAILAVLVTVYLRLFGREEEVS